MAQSGIEVLTTPLQRLALSLPHEPHETFLLVGPALDHVPGANVGGDGLEILWPVFEKCLDKEFVFRGCPVA